MCSTSIHSIQGGGNCIIDLQTGKITQAPGWFDGQWAKDDQTEPIYTIPNKFPKQMRAAPPGLTFIRFSDVQRRGRATAPLYRDPSFSNHYHSFGLLMRGAEASGQVLSIEPLRIERNLTNGSGDTEAPRTGPVGVADPNGHSSYFDLPMISREGVLFAANNRKTMTT